MLNNVREIKEVFLKFTYLFKCSLGIVYRKVIILFAFCENHVPFGRGQFFRSKLEKGVKETREFSLTKLDTVQKRLWGPVGD